MEVIKIIFEKGTRTDGNVLYRRLRRIWGSMIDRCYKENHYAYKNYGKIGATVSDEWKTLDGFLNTIDEVCGWDEDKFLKGNLTLDKDSLFLGNKLYSIKTCKFITKEENNKYKPNQQKEIIGINPFGVTYNFFNQSEFAKIHSLRQTTISDCLNGKVKKHKGWLFYYKK